MEYLICSTMELPEQCIEYIDMHEINTLLLGNNNDDITNKTHCEIHPSLILGRTSSCIPFPRHNQAPRNTYQSAMGKTRAIGIHATNYNKRFDICHILYYPQRPLISNRIMSNLGCDDLPNGMNVIASRLPLILDTIKKILL